jgi:large subunit ribosomal protein L6
MSRVGKKPIKIPAGVTVTIEGQKVTVKGAKGATSRVFPPMCEVTQEGGSVIVKRNGETRVHRQMHGLTRALVNNMIIGVSNGFGESLEIVGVGYRAEIKGKELQLALGFAQPIRYAVPEGVTIEVPEPTKIRISGIEKEKVGQVAAEIRRLRPPEPYKGKGVRYTGEVIHRKAGKTAVSTGG